MTGLKIAATTAIVSGGLSPILAILEPKDMEGLGPAALSTLVALAALALAGFLARNLVPAINKQTEALTINNERQSVLCSKMEKNPCLAETAEVMRREARAIIEDAKKEAKSVVESARIEALRLIEEQKRR